MSNQQQPPEIAGVLYQHVWSTPMPLHNTTESNSSPLRSRNTIETNTAPSFVRGISYIKYPLYSHIVTSCLICYPVLLSSTTTPICSTTPAIIGIWCPSCLTGPGEQSLHRRLTFLKALNSSSLATMRRKLLRKLTPVSTSARFLQCIVAAAHSALAAVCYLRAAN